MPIRRWTTYRESGWAARAAAGDGYVNVLGADIARQCLELGALDEVLAIIAPVLLGDGTRLFEHPGGRQVRLERLSVGTTAQATNVWMRVLGRPASSPRAGPRVGDRRRGPGER